MWKLTSNESVDAAILQAPARGGVLLPCDSHPGRERAFRV